MNFNANWTCILDIFGNPSIEVEAPLGENKKQGIFFFNSNFGTNISPIKKALKANWEHQEIVSMVQEK